MTLLNSGAQTLAPGRHDRHPAADEWLRAGFEGFLLTVLFLVLAGTALYSRARLGFAH